jgi:pyrroloquinoline quinone biosynthesis protein D
MNGNSRSQFAPGVRLFWDQVRQQDFLLFPEGAIQLNPTARAILERCDRHHTIEQIISELSQQFPDAKVEADVYELIRQIAQRGLLNDAAP